MGSTATFTADATGAPETITANTVCKKIRVYEDAQAGTVNYLIRMPGAASTAVTRPAGQAIEFVASGSRFFQPGEVVAYIETATGSASFAQEES